MRFSSAVRRGADPLRGDGFGPVFSGPRGFGDTPLEGFYERLRAFDREVRAQGRLVRPLLEEKQPHRVLAVDMHVMGDTAGLLPGALDMLEARAKHVIKRLLARKNAAGHQNHLAPLFAHKPSAAPTDVGGCTLTGPAASSMPPVG